MGHLMDGLNLQILKDNPTCTTAEKPKTKKPPFLLIKHHILIYLIHIQIVLKRRIPRQYILLQHLEQFSPFHWFISDTESLSQGTIGHLQVFVFSDWLSVSLPIEYSETTKGLRWLIPREKLPWKTEDISMWPQYPSAYEVSRKISMDYRGMSGGYSFSVMGMKYSVGFNSSCIASLLQNKMPSPNHAAPLPIISKHYGIRGWPTKVPTSSFQYTCRSDDVGDPHSQHNVNMKSTPYGLPLNSSEYFIYFLVSIQSRQFEFVLRS